MLAIYIHNMKDRLGKTDTKGKNPFDFWHKKVNSQDLYFSQLYKTYDWVSDRGYDNLGIWVEEAARKAGR